MSLKRKYEDIEPGDSEQRLRGSLRSPSQASCESKDDIEDGVSYETKSRMMDSAVAQGGDVDEMSLHYSFGSNENFSDFSDIEVENEPSPSRSNEQDMFFIQQATGITDSRSPEPLGSPEAPESPATPDFLNDPVTLSLPDSPVPDSQTSTVLLEEPVPEDSPEPLGSPEAPESPATPDFLNDPVTLSLPDSPVPDSQTSTVLLEEPVSPGAPVPDSPEPLGSPDTPEFADTPETPSLPDTPVPDSQASTVLFEEPVSPGAPVPDSPEPLGSPDTPEFADTPETPSLPDTPVFLNSQAGEYLDTDSPRVLVPETQTPPMGSSEYSWLHFVSGTPQYLDSRDDSDDHIEPLIYAQPQYSYEDSENEVSIFTMSGGDDDEA
jgi:hypothetical protein